MKSLTDKEILKELANRLKEKHRKEVECRDVMEQLWKANKKLEQSEKMKSNFISNVTNEIVNPFASILGLSKSIMLLKKTDWDKVQNMVSLIYSEAFNLDFQLNNIFAAAKIEAGEIYPDIFKVNVIQLLTSVVDQYHFLANKKQLTINIDFQKEGKAAKELYFYTDAEKLKLIVTNLLSNSIEFSNAANKINILVRLEEENLVIIVEDFGLGIDKEDQKVIFDRFKQLNSRINSLNKGHGLGLSVVKALLDLLKGKVEIKSQKKHGTAFTITIPEGQQEMSGFAGDDNEFLFDDDSDNEIF